MDQPVKYANKNFCFFEEFSLTKKCDKNALFGQLFGLTLESPFNYVMNKGWALNWYKAGRRKIIQGEQKYIILYKVLTLVKNGVIIFSRDGSP